MKKLFLFLTTVVLIQFSYGQTYYITDGGSISTCSGTLELGNVTAGQTYVFTICSDDIANGNSHVSVALSQYSISNGTLCVYDGNSTAAPQLGCNAWQVPWAITATAANTTGCLTFEYTAQASGDVLVGDIHCNFMCEHSEVQMVSTNPAYIVEDSANYINICEGEQITFTIQGSYWNTTYPQSDATSTFHWDFGDGDTLTGVNLTSVTHTFTGHQGYDVSVHLTDAMNCISSNEITWRVRISRQPSFDGTAINPPAICPCQDVNLSSVITETLWTNEPQNVYADTTYLPDGTGQSYTTSIFLSQFAPGQTINSINDLVSICANMEHSYLGDLIIQITCPSGTTVTLENQGGGGTYLGIPLDYDPSPPGTGWDYCWSPNPTYGIMNVEASNYSTLPSGSYTSYEPLSNLVGCLMNGQWTITVTDNWAIDDGYIFSWWIDFDPSLYPEVWEYQNTVSTQTWTAPAPYGQINSDDGNGHGVGTYYCGQAHPTQTTEPFNISITDDYGCTYDTTLTVIVLPDTNTNCCYKPDLSINTTPQTLCGGTILLDASIEQGFNGQWSMVSGPGTAVFADQNNPQTDVSVFTYGTYTFQYYYGQTGCDTSDQVQITFVEQPVAFAGNDTSICGVDITLNAATPTSGTGTWTGSGATFTDPNSPTTQVHVGAYGQYTLTWTVDNGTCSSSDDIKVGFFPVPTPNAGNDTTVCGRLTHLHAIVSAMDGYWSGPGGTFYDSTFTDADVDATIASLPGSSVTHPFIWHEANGYCTNEDTVLVTFLAVPTPYAGLNQETCDQTTQLEADTIGMNVTSLTWSANIAGVSITPNNIPNPDVSIASMAPTIYGDSGQVTVWFYLNTFNSQGCGNTDSISVLFYQVPEADAGRDDSICGLRYNMDATFDLVNYHSQGQWNYDPNNVPTGATISFNNDSIPHTEVNVSTYGTYYFVWSEWNRENNTCRDYDTVIIYFLAVPNIDAGPDTSVCGNWYELDAITAGGPSGWNAIGGAAYASYPSIDSLNSAFQDSSNAWVYHAIPNDTVTFYWTEYNSFCVSVDSVDVYFAGEIPAVPFVQDSTNCGLVFDNLDAQTPQYGYGYWMDTVNNSQFYDTSATPHPDSVVVSYYGMHHFYWIVNNGACIDTSDAIPILFVQNPIANAGGNYWPGLFGAGSEIKTDTACGYNYYLGAQPTIGLGTWYTTDQVNTWFLNPDSISPDSTATHNPNDTAHTNILTYNANPDYYDFVWVEDNDYGCTDQDTLRLFFAPVPTGDFTVTTPWCIGYPSTIIAHTSYNQIQNDDWGLNNFIWDLDDGIIDTTGGIPSTGLGEDTIYVYWNNGDPSHIVSLLTTSIYGCSSPINFDTIVEPPKMNPDYDIEDATCGLANGIITLYTDTHELTYTWDSTFAAPNDTIQQGLLGGQTYTVLVHGESSSPDAPQGTICTDTLSIYLPDVGYTTALFDTLIPDGVAPYSVSVTNLSINGRNYEWFVYDQNNQLVWSGTDEFPTFTINQEGYYHILLISTSRDDCRDTMEWGEFYVEASSKMEVPNVFTPNGDNTNDYFQVVAKTLSDFHGIITNRWGKKLYEWDNWKDKEAGWNGKIGNSLATPGAYFYIIKATGKDGTEYDLQGTFYLLREKQ